MDLKYIVIKKEDIEDYLNEEQSNQLFNICGKICLCRIECERKINEYIVINKDETYIEDIINVLKKNNHWK